MRDCKGAGNGIIVLWIDVDTEEGSPHYVGVYPLIPISCEYESHSRHTTAES